MKAEFISLADRLSEEGMKKGMERKNWTATENLLQKGMNADFICDVLDVTPQFVEWVRKEMTDPGTLSFSAAITSWVT